MNISDVAETLLEGIDPYFEQRDFRLNKKMREFKRIVNGCNQKVNLIFYKEKKHIGIEPEIKISIKSIDNIYRSVTSIDSRPYCTLGNHLFEILRYMDDGEEIDTGVGSQNDWLVEDSRHIHKLIEVIPEYLEETILPYFNENSSVARADELLNKHPRELSIHNSFYPERANLAIIAAKLNNNPCYDELVDIYEEELEEAAEDYKDEFYKLKKLLSQESFVA